MNGQSVKLYPTVPMLEVFMVDRVYLMNVDQMDRASIISEFERWRYAKRFLEGRKRAADVVTIDGNFLTWDEYSKVRGENGRA